MNETTLLMPEDNFQVHEAIALISEMPDNNYTVESVIQENKIKISLSPSKRKKTKKINVTIEGSFNIHHAMIVKENCIKLMEHFDVISILLKNIEEIDLASLQLLHVLKTLAEINNKRITIDSELSKEDKALIQSAGLENLIVKQHITE